MTDCSTSVLGQTFTNTTCVQLDTLIALTSVLIVVSLVEAGALIWLANRVSVLGMTTPSATTGIIGQRAADSGDDSTPDSFLKKCLKCGARSSLAAEKCAACGSVGRFGLQPEERDKP